MKPRPRRRLVHLYPGEVRVRAELVARERAWLADAGVELLLADDWIAESDRALYADALLLPPAEEVGRAAGALVEWARARRVDALLVQTEAALPAGSLALRRLDLPGPRPEAALRCVGKHLTRAALAAAGVPQPEFALASSAVDVRRFAQHHGFPVMLKAVASTMARLMEKVDSDGALDAAVARLRAGLPRSRDVARFRDFARAAELDPGLDPATTFLVEAFAPGDPVETDGLVVAGRALPFGALEQVMTAAPRFYVEGYLLPADRDEPTAARIRATGARAAEAVGLDASGFSVELRDDGAATRVIEVNGRLGEDSGLHRLFELAVGAPPFRLAVALALGEPVRFEPRAAPRHALAYACSFEEGVVSAVPDDAELAQLTQDGSAGVELGRCVRVGDEMHAPPHPETFPHLAFAIAPDPVSSRRAFERARSLVARLPFTLAEPLPAERAAPLHERLAEDVRRGLLATPKHLSCCWFYDDEGSRLFEEICATPEYYVTRAEDELLATHARAITAALPAGVTVVELGSGSATKTRRLLDALARDHRLARYVMIDISPAALAASSRTLAREYPDLEVVAFRGAYEDGLARLDALAPAPRLVLWLGSNVGNLHRDEAAAFLAGCRARLAPADRLLVGIDARKDRATLERAYDDAAGVTARFNLNLLTRIDRELGGDFDPAKFRHRALYDEALGRVEMWLDSLEEQVVTIARLGLRVALRRGESIHTENSYKYSEAEIDALAAAAGFAVEGRWFDGARRFSETLLAPK
jgi:L-histidine N-alpha-methyltransferase